MSNIISYHISTPQFRIEDSVLYPKFGKKGKHIVCYTDEDIITLANEAAYNCINNRKSKIDAIIFATTTPVFKNRYHASFLTDMLHLPEGILALDLSTSSRSGTDALLLANQMIDAGTCKNVLVVAADTYFPPIGEELRTPFGHVGTAILLGQEKGFAEIKFAQSYSCNIAEEFSYKGCKMKLDARFSRTAGFKNNIQLALQKSTINPSDIDGVILNSLYAKLAVGQFKKAGFDIEKQLSKDTLVSQTGNTRSCHALLLLINALENNTGHILLMDYCNGTNVFQIEQKENTKDKILQNQLKNKTSIETYQDYLILRKKGKWESKGYQAIDMFSSEMIQEREKENLLYLKGFECSNCGTVYYFKAVRCKKCKGMEFEPKQLSRTGTVYALTSEHYFPNSFPPIAMAVIDLDGGGRITIQQTDDMYHNKETELKIGSKVKLVLRKMMENDSKPNYFWKCRLILNS